MRRQVLRKICAREPGSLEVQPQLYTSCGLMKIYQALIVLLVLLERGNGFYVPSLGRLNHESAAVKTHGCGFREAMPMLPSWAIKGAVGDEEKNQSMEDLSGGANTMYDDLRESLKGTCIYLVGMMGKTAVGAGLAEKVGFRFIDSDEAAEWILEMPIADFFTQGPEKEAEFRELEYQVPHALVYTYVRVYTFHSI